MKFLTLLCTGLLLAWMPLPAQTTDDTAAATEDTPPKGSTLITSDELHSDQASHVSVFTGKVVVIGTGFKMTCQEMTVNFTKDNKIETIVATGEVVITQPGRITHCGRAQYYRDEDKFVLTESPVIDNGKDKMSSPTIIIHRTTQQMETQGGRTTMILGPDTMGTPKDSTLPSDGK